MILQRKANRQGQDSISVLGIYLFEGVTAQTRNVPKQQARAVPQVLPLGGVAEDDLVLKFRPALPIHCKTRVAASSAVSQPRKGKCVIR